MSRSLRAGLLLSALVAGGLAVPADAATPVYEVEFVKGRDGALIRLEIMRDPAVKDAPVILTYSPYNTLAEDRPADDAVATRYVPKGYARAVADVLGTRGSDGCWDYGGTKEQQSGADVVMHLANKDWSNGRVGMTGVSYEGTTANMVAALGDSISADSRPDGKGLAGIVPIAAISDWYGYAYGNGVRYLGNSRTPTDEGFDTPLAFDLGFGRTVPVDPQRDPAAFARAVAARSGECGTAQHTERGYDRSPDHDAFWDERDYRQDAANFRVPTMVVHGWQDYNVKQEEGTALFEAIPVDDPATPAVDGVPFKKLWMTQATHANGSGPGYQELLDAFWATTLERKTSKLIDGPAVTSFGRKSSGPNGFKATAPAYSRDGVSDLTLHLGDGGTLSPKATDGGRVSTVDTGTVAEEASLRGTAPALPAGSAWLRHTSAPLTAEVRILGSAALKTIVTSTTAGQHLTPLLVEVLPDGTTNLVERGFLNLDYAKTLDKADATAGTKKATVTFLPQDYTFTKGSRIGVVLQGSNTVWAVPGAPGTTTYDLGKAGGGTKLVLPLAGAGASPLPE